MEFIKCNITKARRLYNQGISIFLVPSNVYPDFNNMWIKPHEININNCLSHDEIKFDNRVNSFSYYNCNDSQTGKRVHFYYIKDEELND